MIHPYIENSQAWCHSLRVIMGYPAHAPDSHTLAFCASAPRNFLEAMQLTQIARDMARDLVHVAFHSSDAGREPLGVSLAVRQEDGVAWLPQCRLYAASETARIELLAVDKRWFVGPRNILTAAKLPPKSRRAHGEEIAMRRWRQAMATVGRLELSGSVWVQPGMRFADAIALSELKVAA